MTRSDKLLATLAAILYGLMLGVPIFAQVGAGVGVDNPPLQGSGGGFDADLLDGQHGAFFQNASNLASGTVPDARLSSDIARLSQSNVFTATGQRISATNPYYTLYETDGAADNKRWDFQVATEQFGAYVTQDTPVSADFWIQVERNGQVIDSVALTATAITANGVDMTPASGTFVANFDTACTTTPTVTFDYQRIGNIVAVKAVSFSGMPCTSDSTSFATTGTPVPASIRPTTVSAISPLIAGDGVNNGVAVDICIDIDASGNVFIERQTGAGTACAAAGWTGSGSKSATPTGNGYAYMLGNP